MAEQPKTDGSQGTPLPSCDMESLIRQLSEMTDKQERYQDHLKAAQIAVQAQIVEERRAELAREQARLDEELSQSTFDSLEEARAAVLTPVQLAQLISEIGRYRDSYAAALSNCSKPPATA